MLWLWLCLVDDFDLVVLELMKCRKPDALLPKYIMYYRLPSIRRWPVLILKDCEVPPWIVAIRTRAGGEAVLLVLLILLRQQLESLRCGWCWCLTNRSEGKDELNGGANWQMCSSVREA